MATPRCIKKMANAMRGQMSDQEALRLLKGIVGAARNRAARNNVPINQAVLDIAGEMKASVKMMAAISRRNSLLSAKAIMSFDRIAKTEKVLGDGVKKLIGRTHDIAMGLSNRMNEQWINELTKAGVWDEFKDNAKAHSRNFYKESWELSLGPNGRPGISGDATALKMAEVWKQIRGEINGEANRWGAYRTEVPGYIITQTHDQRLIRYDGKEGFSKESMSKAFDVWLGEIQNLNIDWERTYDGPDRIGFLREFHKAIYTGEHVKNNGDLDPDVFTSHGSLANKMSSSRVLWFGDAESSWKYNQRYGSADFNQQIAQEFRKNSRMIALLQTMGPNPENNFKLAMDGLRSYASGLDDSVKQLDSLKAANLKGGLDWLMGKRGVIVNAFRADMVDNVKNWTMMTKLGSMIVSQFSDKAFFQQEAAYWGLNAMDRLGGQLDAFASRSGNRAAAAREIGFMAHSLMTNVNSRYVEDVRPSMFSRRALDKMLEWQGVDRWTIGHKRALAEMISHHLGEHSNLPFDQLPMELSTKLNRYDFRAPEWDAIRSTMRKVDGEWSVITPDGIGDMPDAVAGQVVAANGDRVTPANVARLKDELSNRWSAMIVDATDRGIPTPGIFEKELATRGGDRGTLTRELNSLFMTFKGFPMTAALRTIGRLKQINSDYAALPWYSRPHMLMIPSLIAEATVLGYISMWAKDTLNLRSRRELFDQEGKPVYSTILAAMQRGGGLGIYGDFLFSEFNKRSKNILQAAAGPVLGNAVPIGAMITQLPAYLGGDPGIKGETLKYDAFRFVDQNTPFIGFIGVRAILDHYILWNIREMLSPGVLRRTETSMEDKNHQHFLIDPVIH